MKGKFVYDIDSKIVCIQSLHKGLLIIRFSDEGMKGKDIYDRQPQIFDGLGDKRVRNLCTRVAG